MNAERECGHRARGSLAALLAALAMLGPFSVDMYLPAFPAIGREFDASAMHSNKRFPPICSLSRS